MKVFLITFVLFVLVFCCMSLSYLIKRKSIQGSCGGLGNIGVEKVCDCPEPCDARKKRIKKEAERKVRLTQKRIL